MAAVYVSVFFVFPLLLIAIGLYVYTLAMRLRALEAQARVAMQRLIDGGVSVIADTSTAVRIPPRWEEGGDEDAVDEEYDTSFTTDVSIARRERWLDE